MFTLTFVSPINLINKFNTKIYNYLIRHSKWKPDTFSIGGFNNLYLALYEQHYEDNVLYHKLLFNIFVELFEKTKRTYSNGQYDIFYCNFKIVMKTKVRQL